MNKQSWLFIVFTLCSFSQISFANTTAFQKELDDFAWSLGNQYEQELSPTLFDDISAFTNKHRKDYQKARTESLRKWQASKINTSGFNQMPAKDLNEHIQTLSETSFKQLAELQYWKVLNVESMTSMLIRHTWPFLHQSPFDFTYSQIGSLSSNDYLFGRRYATIPLENDEWEVWAYSHALAYRYKWDIKQDQIKDFSVWLKDGYLR